MPQQNLTIKKTLINNEHYRAVQFGNVIHLKIYGFQTIEDLSSLLNTFVEFYEANRGKEFVGLCDLSETILSEYKTAKRINQAIKELSQNINIKYLALIFINTFSTYKYEFAKLFYLRNTSFTHKAFTDNNSAINWIKEKGYDTSGVELYLEDEYLQQSSFYSTKLTFP